MLRRSLLLAAALLVATGRIASADPLSLDFGLGANPVPSGPNWLYTYVLSLQSNAAGAFETMTTANTLTVGPFAGFISAGAPAGWTGALIAGNLVYTPTATITASGGVDQHATFTPISSIGPNTKTGSWAATYSNNSGNQQGGGSVPVPTPEPWNFLSVIAMILPVGLLYFGLRHRTNPSALACVN